jgi:hypothetical protein
MRRPTPQQREAMKSTTGKLEHYKLNTFRYGSWVVVKCPNPDGTFNFNAKLGNAMSMNVDGTEKDFMTRLEACGTK